MPAKNRNGNITQYQVKYEEVESTVKRITTINHPTFAILLDNLHVHTMYSIAIRALTQAGEGKFSMPVNVTTMNGRLHSR